MNTAVLNWKTTAAGVVFGILLAFQTVYKPGMSLKQWAVAAGVAFLGALPGILAHDGFVPKVGPAVLLALILCSPGSAQTNAVPPPTHFSLSGSIVSYMGPGGAAPASIADGYFNLTQRLSLGYMQLTIPTVATAKFGMIKYDCPLSACLGKKLTAKFVFDTSKITLSFLGGAGKLNQSALNVDRVAETAGACISYPVGGGVSLQLACGLWVHGGIVNGLLSTGVPGQPNSSTAAVASGVKVSF